ncbi:mycofactocin-coupled SDR family oxidoreductase [Pseudonocardia pini]|uniref:mycofactocin-coupled SDR family oxidoreductase n=1 Tax=Pseudonocardia pini TaxID=2758030 RepID=UPI0015F0967F|nr:mycofactocin-coupled SDR family oxidoreductase [Pseudonocardia pini]
MGQLDGKVALITGAARGQGRSHAVRLAQEGADIIALDICEQVPSVSYPMSNLDDLKETQQQVEALDRRIVTAQADIRDLVQLTSAVKAGVAELGGLDIVSANAAIWCINPEAQPTDPAVRAAIWKDTIDTNLTGVWHTLEATVPILVEQGRGGSIIITSSTAGLKGSTYNDLSLTAYVAAKHGLTGLMRGYAVDLAKHSIRVNTVHPTGVHTPMPENEIMAGRIERDPDLLRVMANALPIDAVDPVDISNAVLYLAAESGRFVTGQTLAVDAGFCVVAPG